MAVTYAWRLDSDKYAYILPPYSLGVGTDVSGVYGFLSKSPLTGYALRNVAEAAETQFGKDSDGGLSAYTTAFAMMEAKINLAASDEYKQILSGGTEEIFSGWTSLQNADLLSADVYYNVDSTDCADLRGVGIKGTRYLGSITGQTYAGGGMNILTVGGTDLSNMAYIAGGTEIKIIGGGSTYNTVVRPGMAGFTDVYGIYLTDNLEEDGEIRDTTKTPEYMFVIRNGMNGPQGEKGDPLLINDSAVTETLVNKEEFTQLEDEVSSYSGQINQLNENVRILTDYYNTLSLDNINNLMVAVSRLKEQMDALMDYVSNINVRFNDIYDDGGENGGTSIQAIPLGIVKDAGGNPVHNDYTFTGDTASDGNIDEAWSDELSKIKSKKFHLLGYLEDDEKYLISDDGYRNPITMDKLYILPNIGVSLTGITFGVEHSMHVEISGDTTMQKLSATNADFQNEVYSENGFYQTKYDGTITKVDTLTTDDFKEPTD